MVSRMEINEVLGLMSGKFDSFQDLWSLYVTVTIGLLAYVAATYTSSSTLFIRVVLVLAFILFAVVNLDALDKVREQRDGLHKIALSHESCTESASGRNKQLCDYINTIKPTGQVRLYLFHIMVDLVVIFVLLLLPGTIRRYKKLRELDRTRVKILQSQYESPIISRDEQLGVWRLEERYLVKTNEHTFTIPEGFEFDMASIPKPLWWIVAPFELSVSAPLIHDYYYRKGGKPNELENEELDKEAADNIFYEMMRAEGVSFLRSRIAYYAVRVFGFLSWRENGT